MTAAQTAEPAGHVDGWALRRERIGLVIERAALNLFAERGYANVTLVDVAAAAGVSPRTLTRYFPAKEDLLLSQPRRSAAVARAALAAAPSGDRAMAGLWQMWIGMAAGAAADELDELRLWYRAVQTAPHALARGGAELSELIRDELIRVAGQTLGLPASDVRPRVLAAALAAAQEVVMQAWLEGGGRQELGELFRLAQQGLVRGLATSDR
jgi:AcrR family transcriptional regulator